MTMAVTEYVTKFNRSKTGICSHWLRQQLDAAGPSDHVPVWLKKGTMTLPPPAEGKQTPLIMVGPGTGIAAFRSFIHKLASSESSAPQMVLIFGCRSESADYYYKDEWANIPNLKVITAFSRDQEDGSKQYVQHAIRRDENAQYLAELIVEQNAYVYVSGRAKLMPKSVEKAFKEIVHKYLDGGKAATGAGKRGEAMVDQMKESRRYQQEVW